LKEMWKQSKTQSVLIRALFFDFCSIHFSTDSMTKSETVSSLVVQVSHI